MMTFRMSALATLAVLIASNASAKDVSVTINKVSPQAVGEKLGQIIISETASGVSLNIDVSGIGAGPHGFHVHENGSCEPGLNADKPEAAHAAGAHFDPDQTKSHKGPEGKGHKGDLPLLTATDKGVKAVVNADHIKLADLLGRSLMIHEGGDTYSDTPPNGGGNARIACGVVPKE